MRQQELYYLQVTEMAYAKQIQKRTGNRRSLLLLDSSLYFSLIVSARVWQEKHSMLSLVSPILESSSQYLIGDV